MNLGWILADWCCVVGVIVFVIFTAMLCLVAFGFCVGVNSVVV